MVKGLELFKDHFRSYADRYILIGGAACDLAMREAGLDFRATKDLDIVLCVEALDKKFVAAFWEFIRAGGYQRKQKAGGGRQYYRFQKPANDEYPFMLELFSRRPDLLDLAEDSDLTPLPAEGDISSPSAILVNDDYYAFIRAGKRDADGISYLGPEHILPLKARAWIDLSNRRTAGEQIDRNAIKKHVNDVFRLYRIVNPEFEGEVPEGIKKDLRMFLARVRTEKVDLKTLGLGGAHLNAVLDELARIYGLQ